MDRESTWQVITEQRLALAELLDGLSAAQWEKRRSAPVGGSATWQPTSPWLPRNSG